MIDESDISHTSRSVFLFTDGAPERARRLMGEINTGVGLGGRLREPGFSSSESSDKRGTSGNSSGLGLRVELLSEMRTRRFDERDCRAGGGWVVAWRPRPLVGGCQPRGGIWAVGLWRRQDVHLYFCWLNSTNNLFCLLYYSQQHFLWSRSITGDT